MKNYKLKLSSLIDDIITMQGGNFMDFTSILFYGVGLLLLLLLGRLLVWPMKKILKLIGNGILGGITLLLFNFIGGFFGLSIVINPLNAIIVGFLGVAGVILLLIVQVIM